MLAVLVGLIAALGAIATAFSPLALLVIAGVLLTVAAVLISLSIAISVFSAALGVIIAEISILTSLLASENCGAAWAALGYLAVMLITLAVGLAALTFGIIGVGVLLLLADALKTLIPLMIALAALPSEDIWSGIGKIAQALLGFILVGLMATALSPVLLVLSAVLTALGIAMTIASAAMYMFVSAFTGLSALTQVSSELIVSGMSKIADAIHNLVMNVLDHVDEFIEKLHNTIVGSAPKIKELVKSLIEIAATAVNEHLPLLIDTVMSAINIIAEKLHLEGVLHFIGAIARIFDSFFGYIADMLEPVVEAGENTTSSFKDGLTNKIDAIVNAAIDIFVAFCNALGDAINQRADELNAAIDKVATAVGSALERYLLPKVKTVADNVMRGLIKGLSFLPGVAGTSGRIGATIIDNINKGTDSHSPSRKAIKAAKNVITGLILGLRSNIGVVRESRNLGELISDNINGALAVLQDYVERDYSITPTITPVLDMNGLTASADVINGMLSGTTSMNIAASVNARLNKNQNENSYGDITRAIGIIHKDLQDLDANNYTVNGITYDDGSTVAMAVNELIRATRMGRRS